MVADLPPLRSVLSAFDTGLMVVGGLCGVAIVFWLASRGRWRNPLAGVTLPTAGPTLADVGLVILAILAVQVLLSWLLAAPGTTANEVAPGTDAWHRFQAADAATKVLVSALVAFLLVRARARDTNRIRSVGLAAGAAAALCALFVLLPITEVQLRMGEVVWGWACPDVVPPTHPVLRAMDRSAWGTWGTAQLVCGAVFVAPLAEELFFRGLLLQAALHHLRRAWPAIALSAIAFGLFHGQPQDVLPLVTMGIVLGYLRVRCGALWPCMVLHALFNLRTMIFVLLVPELARSE